MKGIPLAARFPETALFTMHPDFPHHTVLTDNLINSDLLVVASQRLKDFLEARGVNDVEYLRVAVRNHKRKLVGRDFFIVNPLEPIECIDLKRSSVSWDCINPKEINRVERLALIENKIPPTRELFRIRGFPDAALVSRKLAEAIDERGFTGIRWREIEEYHN